MTTDQLIAKLVDLGGLGIFAAFVAMELRALRKAIEANLERIGSWCTLIHARLSRLGAPSLAPPVAGAPLVENAPPASSGAPRRHRIVVATPPVGVPIGPSQGGDE